MTLLDSLRELARGLAFAFDRAACSQCDHRYVRWVVVDGPEVIEHLCEQCPPAPSDRVIDLGRDRAATTTELDRLAVRRWDTRHLRGRRPGRPVLLASRQVRTARRAGGAR